MLIYLQEKSYKQLALEVVLLRRKVTHITEINMSNPIGTASANSVEFHGIRPRMYIEDLI